MPNGDRSPATQGLRRGDLLPNDDPWKRGSAGGSHCRFAKDEQVEATLPCAKWAPKKGWVAASKGRAGAR
eukprot:479935-Alexandrium_andersonii.AAC.1